MSRLGVGVMPSYQLQLPHYWVEMNKGSPRQMRARQSLKNFMNSSEPVIGAPAGDREQRRDELRRRFPNDTEEMLDIQLYMQDKEREEAAKVDQERMTEEKSNSLAAEREVIERRTDLPKLETVDGSPVYLCHETRHWLEENEPQTLDRFKRVLCAAGEVERFSRISTTSHEFFEAENKLQQKEISEKEALKKCRQQKKQQQLEKAHRRDVSQHRFAQNRQTQAEKHETTIRKLHEEARECDKKNSELEKQQTLKQEMIGRAQQRLQHAEEVLQRYEASQSAQEEKQEALREALHQKEQRQRTESKKLETLKAVELEEQEAQRKGRVDAMWDQREDQHSTVLRRTKETQQRLKEAQQQQFEERKLLSSQKQRAQEQRIASVGQKIDERVRDGEIRVQESKRAAEGHAERRERFQQEKARRAAEHNQEDDDRTAAQQRAVQEEAEERFVQAHCQPEGVRVLGGKTSFREYRYRRAQEAPSGGAPRQQHQGDQRLSWGELFPPRGAEHASGVPSPRLKEAEPSLALGDLEIQHTTSMQMEMSGASPSLRRSVVVGSGILQKSQLQPRTSRSRLSSVSGDDRTPGSSIRKKTQAQLEGTTTEPEGQQQQGGVQAQAAQEKEKERNRPSPYLKWENFDKTMEETRLLSEEKQKKQDLSAEYRRKERKEQHNKHEKDEEKRQKVLQRARAQYADKLTAKEKKVNEKIAELRQPLIPQPPRIPALAERRTSPQPSPSLLVDSGRTSTCRCHSPRRRMRKMSAGYAYTNTRYLAREGRIRDEKNLEQQVTQWDQLHTARLEEAEALLTALDARDGAATARYIQRKKAKHSTAAAWDAKEEAVRQRAQSQEQRRGSARLKEVAETKQKVGVAVERKETLVEEQCANTMLRNYERKEVVKDRRQRLEEEQEAKRLKEETKRLNHPLKYRVVEE